MFLLISGRYKTLNIWSSAGLWVLVSFNSAVWRFQHGEYSGHSLKEPGGRGTWCGSNVTAGELPHCRVAELFVCLQWAHGEAGNYALSLNVRKSSFIFAFDHLMQTALFSKAAWWGNLEFITLWGWHSAYFYFCPPRDWLWNDYRVASTDVHQGAKSSRNDVLPLRPSKWKIQCSAAIAAEPQPPSPLPPQKKTGDKWMAE